MPGKSVKNNARHSKRIGERASWLTILSDRTERPPWSTCRDPTHSPTRPTYVSIFSLLGCMATRRYIRLDKDLYKRYSRHGARVWDRSGSKTYKAGTVFYIFLSFIWISQLCILLSWSDEVNTIGTFRLDYVYEIEYEYDFRISNQWRFQSPCSSCFS